MNTILKNFLNTLKRFKLSSFLNIAGLSVAFAAFLVIMIQVRYEWTFDRTHYTSDRNVHNTCNGKLLELESYYSQSGGHHKDRIVKIMINN